MTPVSLISTTCNELYANLLSRQKRGHALWIPEPNKYLPFQHQRRGIQIGDVGIIKPDGSFSYIFNICAPHDDPINPPSLPVDFAPIDPPIDSIDIQRFTAFKPGSYLASPSIEISEHDNTSP